MELNEYLNFFDIQDTCKRTGKVKQSRAFFIRTYQPEESIQRFITQNRKKIRSYAYCLHDKDVDENGALITPHTHLILRMYSQWSRRRLYKLFVPFLWDFDGSCYVRHTNIDLEISSDYKANFRYLIHSDNPEKFQYAFESIVTDDVDDFGNHDDKCKDGAFEIVSDIIDGKSQLELLKKYGREFVYHKRQYELLASCIMYEENQQMEEVELRHLTAIPKVKHVNSDSYILEELRRIFGGSDYK